MSMLSVPVKDLNEKKTIDNDTYVVCGNMEANKISYENLVKPLRDELNSTLKWTDWAALGSANELGISMRYRYNAFEVELQYYGNLQNKKISGGSDGYVFPALPDGLNPKYNIEHQIYACAGDNKGNLTLQCFPTGNAKKFTITSHNNVTVTPEYICGYVRYTRQ